MRIAELLHGLRIIDTNVPPESEFRAVTSNSALSSGGVAFIALRGERDDGHEYIRQAQKRGGTVICERLPSNYHGKYIIVENTRRADAVIQANLNNNPQGKLKIIGVTGTNGKTSVCHMLREILTGAGVKCGVIGTVGNYVGGEYVHADMTTPMPSTLYSLLSKAVDGGDEYVILEVSSHSLCYKKTDPIFFALSVFTNLTPDHLDFHGNMESYANAKAALFEKSAISLVNGDDPYGRTMYERGACFKYYYGTNANADYRVGSINMRGDLGISYILASYREAMSIKCRTPGEFNVYNTAAACTAARLLGADCRDIVSGVSRIKSVKGRLERVDTGDGRSIFIDYAHTPDALYNILNTVRNFSGKRHLTLVFGCGGDRDKSKRPVMGKIGAEMADRVIITSDNSRNENTEDIIGDILSGISDNGCVTVVENRREAIFMGISEMPSDGVLLITGKGHEDYMIENGCRTVFDERKIIGECLSKKR